MEMPSADALYKSVGYVKDAHGLKGELFIRLFAGRADWLEDFRRGLLVSPDEGEAIEVRVERAQPHKDGLIVKVSELDDRTPAEGLRGYRLEIPTDILVSRPGEAIYLHEIMGFEVRDATSGLTPVVRDVSSNGAQDLLVVEVNGEERLIPFVRDFIEKIDFPERVIAMRLPPGLLRELDEI